MIVFVHTVYFWFKDGVSEEDKKRMIRHCEELRGKIQALRHTYAVGLCTVFADRDGHDVYQVHELHKEFIARNKALWSRVQVYDFE